MTLLSRSIQNDQELLIRNQALWMFDGICAGEEFELGIYSKDTVKELLTGLMREYAVYSSVMGYIDAEVLNKYFMHELNGRIDLLMKLYKGDKAKLLELLALKRAAERFPFGIYNKESGLRFATPVMAERDVLLKRPIGYMDSFILFDARVVSSDRGEYMYVEQFGRNRVAAMLDLLGVNVVEQFQDKFGGFNSPLAIRAKMNFDAMKEKFVETNGHFPYMHSYYHNIGIDLTCANVTDKDLMPLVERVASRSEAGHRKAIEEADQRYSIRFGHFVPIREQVFSVVKNSDAREKFRSEAKEKGLI